MPDPHATPPTRPPLAPATQTCARTFAVIACLFFVAGVRSTGQDTDAPLLTIDDITTAIGSDTDAQGALSTALAFQFRPQSRPRQEYFLSSQVRAEWLPTIEGVEFVRLTGAEIAGHLANCGRYWLLRRVERSDNAVWVELTHRCGGQSRSHVVSFSDGQWRLGWPNRPPGTVGFVGGVGSGFVGRPPGCPCLR